MWARDPLVDERMVRLQSQRVIRECSRRGLKLLDELFVDTAQRPDDLRQSGLGAALDVLRQGRHAALVVAIFDRLAKDHPELMTLSARAEAEGWKLIVTP